ncbi:hypothetical protein J3D54_005282 [Pseudomonas sp. GGS8]|uniref:hypothetical protein n=1 Tax=Pseudomonas sp. GGS8 TaxID=2817892 RepID=UPI00209D2782|nr:hypothetical protein [Pseudomonas sp. GGS8]MCP1446150.1 hypothetical protein [Pseudomonas sp. GGS8]
MNILIHPAQFPMQHVSYRTVEESGGALPFVRYRVTTRERTVYEGTTNCEGHTQSITTRYPDAVTIDFPDALPTITEEHRT